MLQLLGVLTQLGNKKAELPKYQLLFLNCLFSLVVWVCKDCAFFTFYFET